MTEQLKSPITAVAALAVLHFAIAYGTYVITAEAGPVIWPVTYLVNAMAESASYNIWVFRTSLVLSSLVWALLLYGAWWVLEAVLRARSA